MCVRLQNGTWGDSAATIALTILVSKWPATGWLFCLLLVLPIPAFCQWYLGPYCWKIIGFIMIAKMIDKLKLISTLLGWVCWKALRPFDVFFLFQYGPLYRQETMEAKREASMRRCLDQLNDIYLSDGRPWLIGDHLTLADFAALPVLMYLEHLNYDLSPWQHLKAWLGRCNSDLPYFKECTKLFYEWEPIMSLAK